MTDDNKVEVPSLQDLIDTAVGEKPDDFATAFNNLMRDKLSAAVDTTDDETPEPSEDESEETQETE